MWKNTFGEHAGYELHFLSSKWWSQSIKSDRMWLKMTFNSSMKLVGIVCGRLSLSNMQHHRLSWLKGLAWIQFSTQWALKPSQYTTRLNSLRQIWQRNSVDCNCLRKFFFFYLGVQCASFSTQTVLLSVRNQYMLLK